MLSLDKSELFQLLVLQFSQILTKLCAHDLCANMQINCGTHFQNFYFKVFGKFFLKFELRPLQLSIELTSYDWMTFVANFCQEQLQAASLSVRLWLVVWLSGNSLASINVVALHQTRLVPGWVTVCGRVNHLSMHCNQPARSTQPSTLCGTVKWVSAFGLSNNNKWQWWV